MKISEEDKVLIKKLIEIRNRGFYCSGEQVTKVYNRVFGQNRPNTNCSSCLRSRISELEKALKQWEADEAKKAASGAATEEEPQDNERGARGETESVPSDINKNKRGRPKKKEKEE